MSESDNAYYERNRERLIAAARVRYLRRRAAVLARASERYALNLNGCRDKQLAREATRPRRRKPSGWSAWTHRVGYAARYAATAAWRARHPHAVKHYGAMRRVRERNGEAGRVDYQHVLSSWDGTCGICRQVVTSGQKVHFDHILPLARGGKHETSNLQIAHAKCNLRKGARV